VLVKLPHPDDVSEMDHLLNLAFDADTAAWELSSDGRWRRNGGSLDLQTTLIERQRRRRGAP
jgi:polyphosphate kinase